MLAQKNRLTANSDFKRVQKEGKVLQSVSYGMAICERKEEGPSRFGIVISNKVAPKASHRVKAKRALSEALRQNMFAVKDNFDVVFLAKPIIVKKYTSELMVEVRESLSKAKLFK